MTVDITAQKFASARAVRRWLLGGILLLALMGVSMAAEPSPAGPVSFRNDVMAVLSKAGCNAGACHGNKNGKGGFKLSLRGQDPEADRLILTREIFGRRVNTLSPDESLMLLKPTTQVAHEGGLRFQPDSEEYKILRRWLATGMPGDNSATPTLQKIAVTPAEKVLVQPANQLQISARAIFSDGSQRDISKLAVYESANTAIKISHDGLVQSEQPGETTVLVRVLQLQEPVRVAFVPARPDFKWHNSAARNYIDNEILAKLRTMRMSPSEICNDTVFLRRASLDLLGILPTADEARNFVADKRADKRALLVDQLLGRPEFADCWALKWADLLRLEERALDRKGVQDFHHWIRQSLVENKPLDQFVREILSARGSSYINPAVNYYRAARDPVMRAESTAQLFLGPRLQCAQCHNHPFDRWTQDDYYNWADVFARVNYKVLENRRRDSNDSHEFVGEQIVFESHDGEVKDPRGKKVRPHFLGAVDEGIDPKGDRLDELADWIVKNPLFARAQVNRIWFHLLGRGIVDPIDYFRATNPPSHPALLEALTRDFVAHKFDVRYLIRLIMNSAAYQFSSEPNETNRDDENNFSHALPRRLGAEQMLDAQHQVTGVPTPFNGYPSGLRAGQIPGVSAIRVRESRLSNSDQFLGLFGKPPRLLTCECERSGETTLNQAFQLISGPEINDLLTSPDNRLAQLLKSGKSNVQLIEELYWTALTRAPNSSEVSQAIGYLEGAK